MRENHRIQLKESPYVLHAEFKQLRENGGGEPGRGNDGNPVILFKTGRLDPTHLPEECWNPYNAVGRADCCVTDVHDK